MTDNLIVVLSVNDPDLRHLLALSAGNEAEAQLHIPLVEVVLQSLSGAELHLDHHID